MSAKADSLGLGEILLTAKKKVKGHVVTMRAGSGIKILPALFSPQAGVDISRRRQMTQRMRDHHIEAKRRLDGLLIEIAVAEPTTRRGVATMTASWLRDVVERYTRPAMQEEEERGADKSIYGLAVEFLRESDIGESYRKQLECVLRSISRYEGYVRETKDARFRFSPETVSLATIESFMRYLKDEHDIAERFPLLFERLRHKLPASLQGKEAARAISPRGNNSIHGKMKRLRSLWKWAVETGRVNNNPFAGFKNVAERYGVPYYLTIGERDSIASATMPTRSLETQRDVFVFQCYVGCRVSDLVGLSERNITGGILSYVPQKTHREATPATARVPLHPTALALVERYRGADERGRLFPFISPQKYNESIKAVLRAAGIDRCVPVRNTLTGADELRPLHEVASSHLARRTFIANLYLKVKDPSIICKMSGHTDGSKAFARYRKIEDEILIDAVNKYL